ncbi:hypothetical protein TEA_015691 [Camellia sinensis var. sinensis]|uniref:Hexosyltransferase n=2 Tax=Camellia sinensis TaxID=4442 RepID=A0A4V3WJN1_CAMSN|nr:hypothetical protein TEA_015691 [Camellia sinensis var. sinensis]
MKPNYWRLGFLLLFTLLQHAICVRQSSNEAYVTLLYGDEFLLGVRVLGKSIRDTGSTKDMVVLVSDGVSDYATKLLQADDWIVELISLLANPNQIRPKRFWGVYTKLKIFNMTNYKKVVYLDADTIVVRSVEDLFKCGKFCANLKHSERLNSGVLVMEPSQTVFNDMMTEVNTLPSYTGGDQGFLNSYYAGFANAHVFEPDLPQKVLDSRSVPEMERLSTLYNADVGLYMLANKWMVDEKELRVIHYTLGPLKPWDWWTSWLLKPVDVWQNAREHLEETLPGTGGGKNPKDEILVKLLFLLPLFTLLFCYYRSFLQIHSFCDHVRQLYYKFRSRGILAYSAVSSSTVNSDQQFPNGLQSKVPMFLGGLSVFVCFVAAFISLALALLIVPRQVMPWTGMLLMYEWTFMIFFLLFRSYLHLIYQWGKMKAYQVGSVSSRLESVDYDSGKGHQRQVSSCDIATCYYGLGMAFMAIAAPSLPCFLGITALFLRQRVGGEDLNDLSIQELCGLEQKMAASLTDVRQRKHLSEHRVLAHHLIDAILAYPVGGF